MFLYLKTISRTSFFHHLIKTQIMRIAYSPLLPLLVFSTIMLSLLHPSTCRHISRATYEEELQLNTEFSRPLPQHLPAIAHTVKFNKDDKVQKLYAASHKLVPGGPNPLHNWLDLSFFVIICFHEKSLMLLWRQKIHLVPGKNERWPPSL